jgi:rhodanese-related sulfurtransferase
MTEKDEIFTIFRKYWKILVKWVLNMHDYPEITVDELYNRLNSNMPPLLIDIRSVEDYNGVGDSKYGHIPNSISIPILELESKLDELEEYKKKEIVTMCPGGGLSLAAVDVMREAGFKDVKSLKGGTDAWHRKGYHTTSSD